MTPREVVARAIEFRRPPRLPIENFPDYSDVAWISVEPVKPPQAADDAETDEWLCRWAGKEGDNQGQVKGHPLKDLSRMRDFPWPDAGDPRRYQNIPQRLEELARSEDLRDKYVQFQGIKFLWERMQYLHGFEDCLIDITDDRPEMHEMADRILEFYLELIRNIYRICGSRIQGFRFSDDWGSQNDLHISPDLWNRFFAPRYRRLFQAVHECGWHVWMHSCGKINKIIGRLIELGVDLLNMMQPRVNGIEEIGRNFAGKVCFETTCDIQKTLPTGDRQRIIAEARMLLHRWGTPEGGFLLSGYSFDSISCPEGTGEFVLETFRQLDPYKHGWPTDRTSKT